MCECVLQDEGNKDYIVELSGHVKKWLLVMVLDNTTVLSS